MCGIVGIVANDAEKYKNKISNAIKSLQHRGPDENGIKIFDNCILGHARLSIVDTKSGKQPMSDSDNKNTITFNGEIYGFQEIKKELNNYKFRTNSDTEIILALYEKYGQELFDKLPGMFAFAIWDESKQSLLCARDRFGEKPFYYALGENNEFIFASEIKAILTTGLIKPVLNKDALSHYLQYAYINPKQTIYQNIHTLAPAHYLQWAKNKISINRYWKLPEINHQLEPKEIEKKLKTLLNSAIQKQLIADFPVGAFLSGGLDSSSVVAIASKYNPNIKTYSFGYGKSRSELPFAKEVATACHTKHTELISTEENISELLQEMQNVYDEPFADSSAIPTYLISKLAKKHERVVLTGDGGDEMFYGYSSWYSPLFTMSKIKFPCLSKLVYHRVMALVSRKNQAKYSYYLNNYKAQKYKLKHKKLITAHLRENSAFNTKELKKFKLNQTADPTGKLNNTLDEVVRYDINNYLPGDILVKTDRASMANSIELRSPFLDKDLAEFCLSIPLSYKINEFNDKIILRNVMKGQLPETIINRKKQGFGSSVSTWLESKDMTELKNKYLKNPELKIFKIIPYLEVQKYTEKNNNQTWILLNLSMWFEKHDFII